MKKYYLKTNEAVGEKMKKKSRLKPTPYNILSKEKCDRLISMCERSEHPVENNFIVQTMLILGLRRGEVAHMKKSWVDFNNKRIRIPSHEPCSCSYCVKQVKQKLKQMREPKEKWENVSKEEVMRWYWQPKSRAGVRSIYFGFDPEYVQVLKNFFAKYDEWPYSVATAYKRIKKMLKLAGLGNRIPHDLRKTAATNFAANGIGVFQLMDIMGWDDIQVAKWYVRLAGRESEKALKEQLGDGTNKSFIQDSRLVFYITKFGRKMATRKKKRDEEEWLRSILFTKNSPDTSQKRLDVF